VRQVMADLVLLLALVPVMASAQETSSEPAKGRYFGKPVDLWNAGLKLETPAPPPLSNPEAAPGRVAIRENVWAQPVRTPDGSWLIYTPPKQVLDFLESPSEETARAYLAWKAEQGEKLRKAMLLLAQVRAHEPPGAAAQPAPPGLPFKVTYFKKPSCPHCVTQDAVLASWLPRRPSGSLEVLLPGDRPELWKAYQVRGTPTLVIQAVGQGREEVLVGLQPEAALEASLSRLSAALVSPSHEAKEEFAR
jgi:glutaredoxin